MDSDNVGGKSDGRTATTGVHPSVARLVGRRGRDSTSNGERPVPPSDAESQPRTEGSQASVDPPGAGCPPRERDRSSKDDDSSPVGAPLDFSTHAEALQSVLTGGPDPALDVALRDAYPQTWRALHDRRQTREDRVRGLAATVSVSHNGLHYVVVYALRQWALQTRLRLDSLLELPELLETVMGNPKRYSWEVWEPFGNSNAGKDLRQAKARLEAAKKKT